MKPNRLYHIIFLLTSKITTIFQYCTRTAEFIPPSKLSALADGNRFQSVNYYKYETSKMGHKFLTKAALKAILCKKKITEM